jgi:hypothetical protein
MKKLQELLFRKGPLIGQGHRFLRVNVEITDDLVFFEGHVERKAGLFKYALVLCPLSRDVDVVLREPDRAW